VRVKVLQLHPVVFCVVTAVLTFDFRLVTNETPNEWGPVEIRPCSDTYVFDTICMFSLYRPREF